MTVLVPPKLEGLPALKDIEAAGVPLLYCSQLETFDESGHGVAMLGASKRVLIVNLMGTPADAEKSFLTYLGSGNQFIEPTFLHLDGSTENPDKLAHFGKFYASYSDLFDSDTGIDNPHEHFDAVVITGGPVDSRDFEDVKYWDQICNIFDWVEKHNLPLQTICWGTEAYLYRQGIKQKIPIKKAVIGTDRPGLKIFGLFDVAASREGGEGEPSFLIRHWKEGQGVPVARVSEVIDDELIESLEGTRVIGWNRGLPEGRQAFAVEGPNYLGFMGHIEYNARSLIKERVGDIMAGFQQGGVPTSGLGQITASLDFYRVCAEERWMSPAQQTAALWLGHCVATQAVDETSLTRAIAAMDRAAG